LLAASHKPPPDADQRQQAIGAARKLRELDGKTSLLFAASVRYPESEKFLTALRQLEALAALKRRKRNDAFTPDRKYVEGITSIALQIFGDAPPALICEVAALKVKNPDKVSITKQVSAYKKQHAQPAKV
jgi:hypothetical protein